MSKPIFPIARKSDLLISALDQETIIYDTKTDKASCLDKLGTAVWNACDGESDIASILSALKSRGHQDVTDQIVLMAIHQLEQEGLLEDSFVIEEYRRKSLSRREMIRSLGKGAAALLPVVTTVVVPPAVHAASGLPNGALCNAGTECLSGWCCRRPPFRVYRCRRFKPPGNSGNCK